MTELADIFRRHGTAYRQKYGKRMLPSHRRAMEDIENCRTEALGGHVYRCPACETERYSYHSCKNRHCPKCQGEAGQAWLQRQEKLRLPTPYFLLTFTLPEGMRWVAWRNQKLIYNLLRVLVFFTEAKREAALLLLTRSYPQATALLKAFLGDSSNRPAQVAVAEAIAHSGRTRPAFVQPLLAMLTGKEPSVRAAAANALAPDGGPVSLGDAAGPAIAAAEMMTANTVLVTFSESVDHTTLDPADFVHSSLTVTAAAEYPNDEIAIERRQLLHSRSYTSS